MGGPNWHDVVVHGHSMSGLNVAGLKDRIKDKVDVERERIRGKLRRDGADGLAAATATSSSQLSLEQMFVRLNSLYYVFDQITEMRIKVYELQSRSTNSGGVSRDCFEATIISFDTARQGLLDFLASKIVFDELREHFVVDLYHPTVHAHPLERIVDEYLDSVFIKLFQFVDRSQTQEVLLPVLRAVLLAMEAALLHGGDRRTAEDDDV